MRHSLPLALLGLIAASCQPRSTDGGNQPERSTMASGAAAMPALRPEPRHRRRVPRAQPRVPSAGPGDAFTLANAPGVRTIDPGAAMSLPAVNVPTARVVAQARTHCRGHWYGLYLNGKKLGYAQMGCRVTTHAGKPVFERYSTMVMKAKMYKTMVKIEMTTLARFATTGRGSCSATCTSRTASSRRRRCASSASPTAGTWSRPTRRAPSESLPVAR